MKILAPLRGVTISCFRRVFAEQIAAAGFDEAITPFITAVAGYDPRKDRELRSSSLAKVATAPQTGWVSAHLRVTPQFIGKDPAALKDCLEKIRAAGYETADLNCGCPYPMVRNKGRGSGILRTPEVLRQMLSIGCEVMGAGRFSIKTRLGVERTDELLALMPMINEFPLRFITVHARTARQMYEGRCELEKLNELRAVSKNLLIPNGDLPVESEGMIGRAFIRALGEREDAKKLVEQYIEASAAELCGDRPVLGRMKELIAYWRDLPRWRRRWQIIKLTRNVDELRMAL